MASIHYQCLASLFLTHQMMKAISDYYIGTGPFGSFNALLDMSSAKLLPISSRSVVKQSVSILVGCQTIFNNINTHHLDSGIIAACLYAIGNHQAAVMTIAAV